MALRIGQPLDRGFSEPLGLLSDCHRRIEYFLKVLKLRAYYTDLEHLKFRLERAVQARRESSPHLKGAILPLLEEIVATSRRGEHVPLEKVKSHCRQVLELSLRCYRRMIETNFPNLTDQFGFYRRGHLRAVLRIEPDFAKGDGGGSLLAVGESNLGVDEVTVCEFSEARIDLDNETVTSPSGTWPYVSVRWSMLDRYLYGRWPGGLEYDCDRGVLRRVIYGWIEEDFRTVKQSMQRGSGEPSAQ